MAEAVRKQLGLSRVESGKLVHDVIESVVQALERGEDVKLTNFGTFAVREKADRVGRNPKTGKVVTISARKVISFRASKQLKARVRGKADGSNDDQGCS